MICDNTVLWRVAQSYNDHHYHRSQITDHRSHIQRIAIDTTHYHSHIIVLYHGDRSQHVRQICLLIHSPASLGGKSVGAGRNSILVLDRADIMHVLPSTTINMRTFFNLLTGGEVAHSDMLKSTHGRLALLTA